MSPKHRQRDLLLYERELYLKGFELIAGVDEAGRGPLAGPVCAAACILPKHCIIKDLDDSKKLTPKIRLEVFNRIKTSALFYSIGMVDAKTIDEINILQATFQAMLLAINNLKQKPDFVLFDGNLTPSISIPSKAVIGGDGLSASIAAASVVAKCSRDALMLEYHKKWPSFGFDENKGYGTEKHMQALLTQEPTPIHRRSFDPLKTILMTKTNI